LLGKKSFLLKKPLFENQFQISSRLKNQLSWPTRISLKINAENKKDHRWFFDLSLGQISLTDNGQRIEFAPKVRRRSPACAITACLRNVFIWRELRNEDVENWKKEGNLLKNLRKKLQKEKILREGKTLKFEEEILLKIGKNCRKLRKLLKIEGNLEKWKKFGKIYWKMKEICEIERKRENWGKIHKTCSFVEMLEFSGNCWHIWSLVCFQRKKLQNRCGKIVTWKENA
jgi:hypothetical protein